MKKRFSWAWERQRNPEVALFNNARYKIQSFAHFGSAFLHCIALVRFSHLVLAQSKLNILRVSHGFYSVCIAVMHFLDQRQNAREAFLITP